MHGHWLNHYLGKSKASGGSGSGGGVLVVHDVAGTLDKTYAEIAAAAQTGVVVMPYELNGGIIESLFLNQVGTIGPGIDYGVKFADVAGSTLLYSADGESGYPGPIESGPIS